MSKVAKYILSHTLGGKEKETSECRILEVSLPAKSSADIQFTNISMTVSEGFSSRMNNWNECTTNDAPNHTHDSSTSEKKTILKDVSGLFKYGQLTAIMGPSGAGKSSLLNALTGFSTQGVTGTIRAGDRICELNKSSTLKSLKAYRKKSCYILQDDRLNPLFSVRELMQFAADMKLGNTITQELKSGVIKEVLFKLGLSGTEETRCGNLSGGQKKRLSIAVELIDNPPVLFLDEPTTGLDSLTSTQCMLMLKNLARDGHTIVCTIHQPPASLYSMFDQVYILAEGMCIYNGPSDHTVPYLASLGLQCPKYHNPADYILEIANGEYGKFNSVLAEKCLRNKAPVLALPLPATPPAVENGKLARTSDKLAVIVRRPHELYKFGILFKRCIQQQYRDWTVTHLKVMLHIAIGVLLGLLFDKAGSDASKTISNLGYLLVSVVYLCYTSLMPAVLKFPLELSVLKKENFNNWYNLKTYYIATLVTGMPLQILYSFVFSMPSYFISDQPLEWSRFLMFVLAMTTVTLVADAFGNVIGTCMNPVNGTFIGAVMTCAMLLFTGYLVLFQHMSAVMRVVSNVSYLKYAFEAVVLSLYSYGRQPMDCPSNKEYCHLRYPSELLNEFMLKEDNYWTDITILGAELLFLRILAYVTLRRNIKRSL